MKRKKLFDMETHNGEAIFDKASFEGASSKKHLVYPHDGKLPLFMETRVQHKGKTQDDEDFEDEEELLLLQVSYW